MNPHTHTQLVLICILSDRNKSLDKNQPNCWHLLNSHYHNLYRRKIASINQLRRFDDRICSSLLTSNILMPDSLLSAANSRIMVPAQAVHVSRSEPARAPWPTPCFKFICRRKKAKIQYCFHVAVQYIRTFALYFFFIMHEWFYWFSDRIGLTGKIMSFKSISIRNLSFLQREGNRRMQNQWLK